MRKRNIPLLGYPMAFLLCGCSTTQSSIVVPKDMSVPIISGEEVIEIEQDTEFSILDYYELYDDQSVPTLTSYGTVDTSTVGDYKMTLTATDAYGNIAIKDITVSVYEKEPEPTPTSVTKKETITSNTTTYQEPVATEAPVQEYSAPSYNGTTADDGWTVIGSDSWSYTENGVTYSGGWVEEEQIIEE